MLARKIAMKLTLLLVASAVALSLIPVAAASPVSYDFSLNVNSGPLSGTYNGNFSYDSSSIIAGGYNNASGLLTSFNLTFGGTTYNAVSANTGWLGFDSSGNLDSFLFGNNCTAGTCDVVWGTNQFFAGYAPYASPPATFIYSTEGWDQAATISYPGAITFAPATVHVPEPGDLGIFSFGILLLLMGKAMQRLWSVRRAMG